MKKLSKVTLGLLCLALLSGCGRGWYFGPNPPALASQEFPFDAVKLLSPDIKDSYDERANRQLIYVINPNQRLLLRFEKLKTHFDSISTNPGDKMVVGISLNQPPTGPVTGVKLCPVIKNWSMHATWAFAHPFSGAGNWNSPGGDFQANQCSEPTFNGPRMLFDVTDWYINHARGTGKNLGLILVSETEIEIAGEKNEVQSPRIFFKKWVR